MNDDNLTTAYSNACLQAGMISQYAKEINALLAQNPEYMAAITNLSRQFTACLSTIMPQIQEANRLLAPALMRMSQETSEIWKQTDVSLLVSQLTVATQCFSDALQTRHEMDELVSISTAEAILKDAQPLLADDAAAAVEHKIEAARKPADRISWRDIIEVIGFILCVLTFAKDMLPDKHDQFMESEIVMLRENQEKQIQLMDGIYQAFHDFCDDSVEFNEKLQQPDDFANPVAEDKVVKSLNENADTQNRNAAL